MRSEDEVKKLTKEVKRLQKKVAKLEHGMSSLLYRVMMQDVELLTAKLQSLDGCICINSVAVVDQVTSKTFLSLLLEQEVISEADYRHTFDVISDNDETVQDIYGEIESFTDERQRVADELEKKLTALTGVIYGKAKNK